MNKVEQQFADKFTNRYGILLLSKADAIDMVHACISQGVRVLGIDGFWLFEDAIQPSLENSVDFSSKLQQAPYLDQAFRDPIEFLKTRDDRMFFEVVCSDSPSA